MIEPTVQFFQKVMTIFPTKAPKPSDDFVEKFLITTCVPQLEQALGNVFEATLCGPDGTVAVCIWIFHQMEQGFQASYLKSNDCFYGVDSANLFIAQYI